MNIKAYLQACCPDLVADDFSTHSSDLYVLGRPGVQEALEALPPNAKPLMRLSKSDVRGNSWYGQYFYDLTFANTAWWEARSHTPPAPPTRGKFIVIEGIDGTGKSSQVKMLGAYINNLPTQSAMVTREPTTHPLGLKARAASMGTIELTRAEELECFAADRRCHLDREIFPSIAAGLHVVCDRYVYSNVAYQSRDGHLTREEILQANDFAPQPDLTIILDMHPADALARIAQAYESKDKEPSTRLADSQAAFERVDTLTHCREVFLSFRDEPGVVVIPADGSPLEVFNLVLAAWEGLK